MPADRLSYRPRGPDRDGREDEWNLRRANVEIAPPPLLTALGQEALRRALASWPEPWVSASQHGQIRRWRNRSLRIELRVHADTASDNLPEPASRPSQSKKWLLR